MPQGGVPMTYPFPYKTLDGNASVKIDSPLEIEDIIVENDLTVGNDTTLNTLSANDTTVETLTVNGTTTLNGPISTNNSVSASFYTATDPVLQYRTTAPALEFQTNAAAPTVRFKNNSGISNATVVAGEYTGTKATLVGSSDTQLFTTQQNTSAASTAESGFQASNNQTDLIELKVTGSRKALVRTNANAGLDFDLAGSNKRIKLLTNGQSRLEIADDEILCTPILNASNAKFTSQFPSLTTGTGAVVISGGLGVGQAINAGTVNATTGNFATSVETATVNAGVGNFTTVNSTNLDSANIVAGPITCTTMTAAISAIAPLISPGPFNQWTVLGLGCTALTTGAVAAGAIAAASLNAVGNVSGSEGIFGAISGPIGNVSANTGRFTVCTADEFRTGNGIFQTATSSSESTTIGTNSTDGNDNTRIVIAGNTRSSNPGAIEYRASSTGKHEFYNQGSRGELLAGRATLDGTGTALTVTNTAQIGTVSATNVNTANVNATVQVVAPSLTTGNGVFATAPSTSSFTIVGSNPVDGASNTRIIVSGFQRAANPGGIEYIATSTGRHVFSNTATPAEIVVPKLSVTGAATALVVTNGASIGSLTVTGNFSSGSTTVTNLTASGTITGATGNFGAINGPIGTTTPSTGVFTTVTANQYTTGNAIFSTAATTAGSTTLGTNATDGIDNTRIVLGGTARLTNPGGIEYRTSNAGKHEFFNQDVLGDIVAAKATLSGVGTALQVPNTAEIGTVVVGTGTITTLNATNVTAGAVTATSLNLSGALTGTQATFTNITGPIGTTTANNGTFQTVTASRFTTNNGLFSTSPTPFDFTLLGTNATDGILNTRIILSGALRLINPGSIEYRASGAGTHQFYNQTGLGDTVASRGTFSGPGTALTVTNAAQIGTVNATTGNFTNVAASEVVAPSLRTGNFVFATAPSTTSFTTLGTNPTDGVNNTRIIVSGFQRPDNPGGIEYIATATGKHVFTSTAGVGEIVTDKLTVGGAGTGLVVTNTAQVGLLNATTATIGTLNIANLATGAITATSVTSSGPVSGTTATFTGITGPIGATTPNTGTFTTVTASGFTTDNGLFSTASTTTGATTLGTNATNGDDNTRILLAGHLRATNPGAIEYRASSTGKHEFYNQGVLGEIVAGKATLSGPAVALTVTNGAQFGSVTANTVNTSLVNASEVSVTGPVFANSVSSFGTVSGNTGSFTNLVGSIGQATPNPGAFTTLTANSATITNLTASTLNTSSLTLSGNLAGTTATFTNITGPIGTTTPNLGTFTTATASKFTTANGIFDTATTPTGATTIGTNAVDGVNNTRIVVAGNTRATNPGAIEYRASSTGKHEFYNQGTLGEIVAGKATLSGAGLALAVTNQALFGGVTATTVGAVLMTADELTVGGPVVADSVTSSGAVSGVTGSFTNVVGPIGAITPNTGAFSTLDATTGNIATLTVGTLDATTLTFDDISGTNATFTNITGPIGAITPNPGTFTVLNAPTGTITNLTTTNLSAGPVTATSVTSSGNVSGTNASFTNITGPIGTTTANAGVFTTLNALSGTIPTLTTTNLTAGPISATSVTSSGPVSGTTATFTGITGPIGATTANNGTFLTVTGTRFTTNNGLFVTAPTTTDFTLLGSNPADGINNTRIILSGFQRAANPGAIEYRASAAGTHQFYNQSGLGDILASRATFSGPGTALTVTNAAQIGTVNATTGNFTNVTASGTVNATTGNFTNIVASGEITGGLLNTGNALFATAPNTASFTTLGSNPTDGVNNTRIIVSGFQRTANPGGIEYIATATGVHSFTSTTGPATITTANLTSSGTITGNAMTATNITTANLTSSGTITGNAMVANTLVLNGAGTSFTVTNNASVQGILGASQASFGSLSVANIVQAYQLVRSQVSNPPYTVISGLGDGLTWNFIPMISSSIGQWTNVPVVTMNVINGDQTVYHNLIIKEVTVAGIYFRIVQTVLSSGFTNIVTAGTGPSVSWTAVWEPGEYIL